MKRHTALLAALLLTACGSDGGSGSELDGGGQGARDDAGGAARDGGSAPDGGAQDARVSAGNAGDAASAVQNGPSSGFAAQFPAGSFFRADVSGSPVADNSARTLAALRAAGGFGNGDVVQIDFSIDVLTAAADTPRRTFELRTEANGYDYDEFYTPDCDDAPVPVPVSGNVEGEEGYACEGDGDCHLIVWSASEAKMYELWRANIDGSGFSSGCMAVWDTSKVVAAQGRGLQCSSADAAGFPISALLFSADEVAAGEIAHAIRFILPNDRVRRGFVPPATHGSNTTGSGDAPYYGVHLRLRADYPLASLPNEGARVVARALQRYGMYHADGGNIALTAQSDRHTQAKWDGLLGPRDLSALAVEDFDVIDHGAPIALTYDCTR